MTHYDVLFIHPPAVYDYRKKPLFPGALGATKEQVQFTKVPIGLLSLADYLDRHGYKVLVDNLGDRMTASETFDVEEHLKNASAEMYAVGLHFQQHSQGAIEIARLCKKLHPGSRVVMGGLTATRFHREILEKYDFVDAVIRGETEEAFLGLLRALERKGKIDSASNLTYRSENGEIRVNPLVKTVDKLDKYEYTRFDLLEPKTSVMDPQSVARWSLEVCRGCVYNCTICGGSAYSYKTYLGRDKPAFRSPKKIVRDMKKLNEQGIRFIGLYQDPRMAGGKYWRDLLAAIRKERPVIERLSLDILAPADEEFIKAVASIGKQVVFHICPDTGSETVRRKLGRHYSNAELIKTLELCYKYFIPVTTFFSVGLAGETRENLQETWELWQKLMDMEQIALTRGSVWGLGPSIPVYGPIVGPIVLDPGSAAFDNPEQHGYKLLYRNLEEYIRGLSEPSWHQWLNYETDLLKRQEIVELVQDTLDFAIDQREQYEVYNYYEAAKERLRVAGDRITVKEIDQISALTDAEEKKFRLESLSRNLDTFLKKAI